MVIPVSGQSGYNFTIKQSKFERKGSSALLTVTATLTNNTNDTLKYLNWSCGRNDVYSPSDGKAIFLESGCPSYELVMLYLAPHKSSETRLKIVIQQAGDSALQNFKMGIYLIKAKSEDDVSMQKFEQGKVNSNLVWSNTINALQFGQPADSRQNATVSALKPDTLFSDIENVNFIISGKTLQQGNYIAEHSSEMSDSGQNAGNDKEDKGQIFFPCKGRWQHDFIVEKDKVVSVVSIKYNMDVYDKTDYVFTKDEIYEIHSFTADAGAYTQSDIQSIPNDIILSGKIKYATQKKEKCNFNGYLFDLALTYCKTYNIKIK